MGSCCIVTIWELFFPFRDVSSVLIASFYFFFSFFLFFFSFRNGTLRTLLRKFLRSVYRVRWQIVRWDNFASDFLFPLKMAAPGRRDGDVINTPFVRVQFGARYLHSLPVTRPHSEEGKRVYAMSRQIHPAISRSMVTILSRPLASRRLHRVL